MRRFLQLNTITPSRSVTQIQTGSQFLEVAFELMWCLVEKLTTLWVTEAFGDCLNQLKNANKTLWWYLTALSSLAHHWAKQGVKDAELSPPHPSALWRADWWPPSLHLAEGPAEVCSSGVCHLQNALLIAFIPQWETLRASHEFLFCSLRFLSHSFRFLKAEIPLPISPKSLTFMYRSLPVLKIAFLI